VTGQPTLNIEALTRLDMRPDEILAVTLGVPDLTVQQCAEAQEWLTEWLAEHGQPVAGVLVLPQGSQLAAMRVPEPVDIETPANGIKATHHVTFEADEIKKIRDAAHAAGATTVTRYLHDLAVAASHAPRVNVDFTGTDWTDEQMDQFIREYTERIRREPPRQH
jgi:hypothetical protein